MKFQGLKPPFYLRKKLSISTWFCNQDYS